MISNLMSQIDWPTHAQTARTQRLDWSLSLTENGFKYSWIVVSGNR